MSWVSDAWDWYIANRETAAPLLAPLGSVLVGMGTIIVGGAVAWSALRQARTATNRHREQTRADQQRRLTESFSKAVEQLASDKMEARLGGIYTLERIAIEVISQVRSPSLLRRQWRSARSRLSQGRRRLLRLPQVAESDVQVERVPPDPVSDLYWTVMETLTAFVRERARWEEPEPSEPEMAAQSDLWQSGIRSYQALQQRPTPATDIAAVLQVLRRRPEAGREREKQRGWRLNLNTTDLRGAVLSEAHLEGADLRWAHLERAELFVAHLEGADLRWAHFERAALGRAHFKGALLRGAHFKRAFLRGAHFKRAVLFEAHLEGADLSEAHLEGDYLSTAFGDARTDLPKGVPRPAHWPPYEP